MSYTEYTLTGRAPAVKPQTKVKRDLSTSILCLAGNPNCGKTSIFNSLTGSDQYVGNYAGATVEKMQGRIKYGDSTYNLTDLPGTYSLSPGSADEKAAADFLKYEDYGVILNVLDSSHMERSLSFTLQLLSLKKPTVIILTFMDELERSGFQCDVQALEKALSVRVFPYYRGSRDYSALFSMISEATAPVEDFSPVKSHAKSRYKLCAAIACEVVHKNAPQRRHSYSPDLFLAGKYTAVPAFILIMLMIFTVTFGSLGAALSDMTSYLICVSFADFAKNLLSVIGASNELSGLICDGIIKGVGAVVAFIPQLALFFFFISLLEESGYMARTAFIADHLLEKFGLSGRAVIPLLMGFGCSVPAIMAARTSPDEKQRKFTVLLVPFMSCSAKMPVYAAITSALFGEWAGIVIFVLYLIGIAFAFFSALIFKTTGYFKRDGAFILELPPYRLPAVRSTFFQVRARLRAFLAKAGTLLLAASIILWSLQNFTPELSYSPDVSQSILCRIGTLIAPIFTPLGFGTWQATVSLISGIAAKEAILSSLQVLGVAASDAIFTLGNPKAAALSFLVFILLYSPCAAALATIKKETGSVKWSVFSLIWQTLLAYIAAFAAKCIGAAFLC